MSSDRPARYEFSPLNVMIVEHNVNMQKLLRTILHALGVRNLLQA